MLILFLIFLPSHSRTYLFVDEFDLLSSPRIFAIHLMCIVLSACLRLIIITIIDERCCSTLFFAWRDKIRSQIYVS